MLLPDDITYEIDRARRQAQAVTIYLKQHQDHLVSARMLERKIQSIRHYIQYLETQYHIQEKLDQD